MRRIDFHVDLFKSDAERIVSEKVMYSMLAALCLADAMFLRLHPGCPMLYDAGVRYQKEPPGKEEWLDIPNILRAGWGDCEDLACWRVAELRTRKGVRAKPNLTFRKDGNVFRYHVTVKLPDGTIEDPSLRLGMGAW